MIEYLVSKEMRLGRGDLIVLGHTVIRNWFILSMFAIGGEAADSIGKIEEGTIQKDWKLL